MQIIVEINRHTHADALSALADAGCMGSEEYICDTKFCVHFDVGLIPDTEDLIDFIEGLIAERIPFSCKF